jgi:peptidoglycan/LPS O-acetylase OafA/YrhL
VFNWFFGYGRMAVQVFLVIGGYLAAKSLSAHAGAWQNPLSQISKRFVRLIGPYLVALCGAVLCAAVVRDGLTEAFVPHAPTVAQWLAHAALVQGLLGFDGLSAGIWYVAIDFQLFAALALVLWAARGTGLGGKLAVLALASASLWVFNRDAAWDNWALYFFGAYALGAFAWWAAEKLSMPLSRYFFAAALGIAVLSLAFDFRTRVALACCTAALLWWFHPRVRPINVNAASPPPSSTAQLLVQLGQQAYALFLVHFSVLLLTNLAFKVTVGSFGGTTGFGLSHGAFSLLFLVIGWFFSMALAAAFFRYVERPLAVWQGTWGSGKRDRKR